MPASYEISIYVDQHGRCPWVSWLARLRDSTGIFKIESRIRRLRNGNLGDCRNLGGGLVELRIDHGPGYRIYCHISGAILIILLCGGDKKSQQSDIARARSFIEGIKRGEQ